MKSYDPLSFALLSASATINSGLNRKQYKQQLTDLQKFIKDFGFEVERHIYKTLFSSLLSPSTDSSRLILLQQLFTDLGNLFDKPNSSTIIQLAFDRDIDISLDGVRLGHEEEEECDREIPTTDPDILCKVNRLCKQLKFSEEEKLFLLVSLGEQVSCLEGEVNIDKCIFNPARFSTHSTVTALFNSDDNKSNILGAAIQEELISKLDSTSSPSVDSSSAKSSDTLEAQVNFLHFPFRDGGIPVENTLSPSLFEMTDDQMSSMFTGENLVQRLKSDLKNAELTPSYVLSILADLCDNDRICSTPSTLGRATYEEIDVLCNMVCESMPSSSPAADMMSALDSELVIPLNSKLLGSILKPSCKNFLKFWHFYLTLCTSDKAGLPLIGNLFFRTIWVKNHEIQFLFLVKCLRNHLIPKLLSPSSSYPSSVISELVPHIDSLKCQPDVETTEVVSWRFQHVYQLLVDFCVLSSGQAVHPYVVPGGYLYHQHVMDLLKMPIALCPDLVILGLMGCTGDSSSHIRKELMYTIVPTFLGNHINSAVILHHLWNFGEQKPTSVPCTIILNCMADFYIHSPPEDQQQRLSRVLDLAQDLKCLNFLLGSNHFPFVIDLACLASRREYLKLDKWLIDKVTNNGEPFISAVVTFLNKRCPALLNSKMESNPNQPAVLNSDTMATILHVLNSSVQNQSARDPISKDIHDNILTMVANSNLILRDANSRLNPPGPVNLPIPAPRPTITSVTTPQPNSSVVPNLRQSMVPPIDALNQLTLNEPLSSFSSIFPDMNQTISAEVEKEADTYFQKIYNSSSAGSMSIDEVLEMLRRFQDSPIQKEKDIFTCMIRNLFKEYVYFPQYPDRELITTAQLFGGIVQNGLVKYGLPLVYALRYVLDALRKPNKTKMFYFGITALDRFKNRLKEYPLYCQHVTSISHFEEFPPHLILHIKHGCNSELPPVCTTQTSLLPPSVVTDHSSSSPSTLPNKPGGVPFQVSMLTTPSLPSTAPTNTTSSPPVTSSLLGSQVTTTTTMPTLITRVDVSPLVPHVSTYPTPPEPMQDKIGFIINNLSMINVYDKAEDFKLLIGSDNTYYKWIVQYLVTKRISIEQNFHPLYFSFVEILKNQDITNAIVEETMRNVKVLLKNVKSSENFSERSLLKNLGHWLGMVTIGKGIPINDSELNLKKLLLEAYHRGTTELLYCLPFTVKILESTGKSKIFKMPNPWTEGMIRLLVELHEVPDLKLNLKFEVEVLCKGLDINWHDFKDEDRYILRREDLRDYCIRYPQMGPTAKAISQIPNLPSVGSNPDGMDTAFQSPQVSTISSTDESLILKQGARPEVAVAPVPGLPESGIHVFNYNEMPLLTPSSVKDIMRLISIPTSLPGFLLNINIKTLVIQAMEKALSEWLNPVVERSIRIAMTCGERLIRKDFALESDDQRMSSAANNIIRTLTAGMSMITCKETMYQSLVKSTDALILRQLNPSELSSEHVRLITAAATSIANENIGLCVAIVQKSASEKAVSEIEKRLSSDIEIRRKARLEGRRYVDHQTLQFQMERMPEQIRQQSGSIPSQYYAVYEEMGRTIPGFTNPHVDVATHGGSSIHDESLINLYDKLVAEMENLQNQFTVNRQPPPLINTMNIIIEAINVARLNPRDVASALALINRVIDAIQEILSSVDNVIIDLNLTARARDLYLVVLKALADERIYGSAWTTKQITRIVLEKQMSSPPSGPNSSLDDYFDIILRSGLLDISLLDRNVADLIERGKHEATIFGLVFVKSYCSQGPLSAPFMISAIQKTKVNPDFVQDDMKDEVESEAEFHRKTELLLQSWLGHVNGKDANNYFPVFIKSMTNYGILKSDENICRFFRVSLEMISDYCVRQMNESMSVQPPSSQTVFNVRGKCYVTLDSFNSLIFLLLKNSGSGEIAPKMNFLTKILNCIAAVCHSDQERKGEHFQHLPFFRILLMLFVELTNSPSNLNLPSAPGAGVSPEPYESTQFQILTIYANTLRQIKPQKCPTFAYAWMDFICNRTFLDKCLNGMKGWTVFSTLLIDILSFLNPFLKAVEIAQPIDLLYRSTLKLLLILLHDFPEFLCEFSYDLVDNIPCNAIQMRNLILSAFPSNMRLPDPFTPTLKIDILPESVMSPKGNPDAKSMKLVTEAPFYNDLEHYLKSRGPVDVLSSFRTYFTHGVSPNDSCKYNISLINAVVLHVGQAAIAHINPRNINMSTISHSSHMDVFQNMAVDLDTQGRYIFLNSLANQLRYPNSHTHYFSCVILCLFAETNTPAIQEQITRVLLERLIVNRPHPWGLLVTFIELIRNPTYKFWTHEFVRCAPEIEKLFESVAKSCMPQNKSVPPTVSEVSNSTVNQSN